jgi:hypothetical protein
MDEDQPEHRPPPVAPDEALLADLVGKTIAESPDHPAWIDERFLTWLAEPEGARSEAELSRAGRRLMVRAFCRKFGVQLLRAPARVAEAQVVERRSSAPVVDLDGLMSRDTSTAQQVVFVPIGCERFSCVALHASEQLQAFTPFIGEGDTLLIALTTPDWSPAATLRVVDGRLRLTSGENAGDFVGTLVALWSDLPV